MADCSRREFNALLVAGAASALLPACNPYDGQVDLVGGTATLSFAQFPSLAMAGGAAIVDVRGSFPIAVVRTSATAAAALSATCTHAWCILRYSPQLADLHCDCHNADFALDGAVRGGPTTIPLPTYATTIGPDAITVAISS